MRVHDPRRRDQALLPVPVAQDVPGEFRKVRDGLRAAISALERSGLNATSQEVNGVVRAKLFFDDLVDAIEPPEED